MENSDTNKKATNSEEPMEVVELLADEEENLQGATGHTPQMEEDNKQEKKMEEQTVMIINPSHNNHKEKKTKRNENSTNTPPMENVKVSQKNPDTNKNRLCSWDRSI